MPRKITPKEEPADERFVGEKEFDKPADELLEAVRQRLLRNGDDTSFESVVEIAKQILENRK